MVCQKVAKIWYAKKGEEKYLYIIRQRKTR